MGLYLYLLSTGYPRRRYGQRADEQNSHLNNISIGWKIAPITLTDMELFTSTSEVFRALVLEVQVTVYTIRARYDETIIGQVPTSNDIWFETPGSKY
jgi:hypothetical protein